MKRLLKNASGPQTLLSIGLIAQFLVIAIHSQYDFIIFDISGMNGIYFIAGGFVGMVILSQFAIRKAHRKYFQTFIFQREAMKAVTRRFSVLFSVNAFFCFTTASSIVGNYEIAHEFSLLWTLTIFVIGTMIWYLLLYFSVYIYRKLFYSPPETTLDQILWEEGGDF